MISEVDEAEVNGALGELLATSFRRAFANGVWGWFDDDLAFVRPWGFELGSIRRPGLGVARAAGPDGAVRARGVAG